MVTLINKGAVIKWAYIQIGKNKDRYYLLNDRPLETEPRITYFDSIEDAAKLFESVMDRSMSYKKDTAQ